jgi:hypothetical protein
LYPSNPHYECGVGSGVIGPMRLTQLDCGRPRVRFSRLEGERKTVTNKPGQEPKDEAHCTERNQKFASVDGSDSLSVGGLTVCGRKLVEGIALHFWVTLGRCLDRCVYPEPDLTNSTGCTCRPIAGDRSVTACYNG